MVVVVGFWKGGDGRDVGEAGMIGWVKVLVLAGVFCLGGVWGEIRIQA